MDKRAQKPEIIVTQISSGHGGVGDLIFSHSITEPSRFAATRYVSRALLVFSKNIYRQPIGMDEIDGCCCKLRWRSSKQRRRLTSVVPLTWFGWSVQQKDLPSIPINFIYQCTAWKWRLHYEIYSALFS